MLWILAKTDLDLIDPICDMAERVLHLVPENIKLDCIWAISAAKRRANQDELEHAYYSAMIAASASSNTNSWKSYYTICAAANVAVVAAFFRHNTCVYSAASLAANTACCAARCADAEAVYTEAKTNESKKQCDILRKHFAIDKVREAFSKLVDH